MYTKYSLLSCYILLLLFQFSFSLTCEKVASLPKDFDTLLPNHHKLVRAHLANYFFLDDTNDGNALNFKLNIPKKSIVKIQITPFHANLKIDIKTQRTFDTYTSISGIPVDFTVLDPSALVEGDVNISFYDVLPQQDTLNMEIRDIVNRDTVCNVPYMMLEILYEHYEHYEKRIKEIAINSNELPDFKQDFWSVFNDLDKAKVKAKSNDLLVQKVKRDITSYRLNIKDKIAAYTKYKINAFADFDVTVPELHGKTENSNLVTKLFIKLQMYSEFAIGGGLHIIIINKKLIDSLKDFDCVYDGRCLMSKRSGKNGMILETILTPGEYKLLVVNMNMNSKEFSKYLSLKYIPISAGIKIKNIQSTENRFDCKGRRLPATFNHLINLDQNYFEYKGKIIFNMRDLMDEVYFTIPFDDDYILRLNAYFSEGNNIKIRLYEIDSDMLYNSITKNMSIHSNNTMVLDEIKQNSTMKILTTESSSIGGQSSVYAPLYRNKIYYIQFDYSDSFFAQYDRKSCEIYYLKLSMASMTHIKNLHAVNLYDSSKCVFDSSIIDSILTEFSKGHSNKKNYLNNEYKLITKEILSFNDLYQQEDIRIIYSKNFVVETDISFYIEVMSDFLTSSVIPILVPKGSKPKRKADSIIEELLSKENRKLLLHKGTINLKLSKGEYTLILIHGLNQFTKTRGKGLSPLYNEVYLPKCAMFKLKIQSILLDSKKMLSWECNYMKYHHIPEGITLNDQKDKYYYFNHHILIPITRDVIKIKTASAKYFLRLRAQFDSESDLNSMSIALKKKGKTMTRGRREIFEAGSTSLISYMNYMLLPDTEYEIHFANVNKNFGKFYDKCRVFTLDLLVTNINSARSKSICENKIIPNATNVVYERLIDLDNTFTQYKTMTLYQMMQKSKKELSRGKNDLEVNQNTASMFIFKFKKGSQMSYVYPFEVSTTVARATLTIETPYALPVEISAKIYYKRVSSTDQIVNRELIGTMRIEDESVLSLRGVLLTNGKYEVEVGVNEKMYREKMRDVLNDFCVEFTASLILENKPYDARRKSALQKSESCPYNEFPNDLRIPGWINYDTSYSINAFQRFKIKNEKMAKKFTVFSRALFKFYMPDEDNSNIHKGVSLSLDKGNRENEIVHKIGKEDNYIALILDPGQYILEFQFELNEKRSFFIYKDQDDFEHLCYFFDVYLSLQPFDNFLNVFDNDSCQNDLEKISSVNPDSSKSYLPLSFKAKSASDTVEVLKTIHLAPNKISKSRFTLEIIYNTYLDPLLSFAVYKINPSTRERLEINRRNLSSGNFMWVVVNVDKSTEYEIELIAGGYENLSLCSQAFLTYNYNNELVMDEPANKLNCDIQNKVPHNFFDNSANVLTPFGKGQNIANGEMYFNGEFLVPKTKNTVRGEFIVKEDSLIFLQVIPKYSKNMNNVFIELFKGRNKLNTFIHNNFNGLVIASISNKSYDSTQNSDLNYYLDMTFEKRRTKCETFTMLLSLIPIKSYKEVYVSCENVNEDSDDDDIPSVITLKNTDSMSFSSYTKRGFDLSKNNDTEKNITLNIERTVTLQITLKYVHSDNMMDISLTAKNSTTFIMIGEESVEGGHVNGVWIHKSISITLKKGVYYLKLLHHGIFKTYLERIFNDMKVDNFCFGFDLEISATALNVERSSDDDESNDDKVIKKLTNKELGKNAILSIKPSNANKLRIGNKLDISILFAYDFITNAKQLDGLSNLIYLTDEENSEKIYPSYISDYKSDKLIMTFELSKEKFSIKHCYRMHFNSDHSSQLDDLVIEKTVHKYCMMKCDCNEKSNYSCSLKGKCRCKSPYTGVRCEKCIEGYVMTNDNQCIPVKLNNMKCDDKTTCNNNGHCIIPGEVFNPFDKNIKNPCQCNSGFASLKGYPTTSFCNKCDNNRRYYPFCGDNDVTDSSVKERKRFSFSTHCSDFTSAPTLPIKLYSKSASQSKGDVVFSDIQREDGSLSMSAIYKVKEDIEYTSILVKEDSLIRIMFLTRDVGRGKVSLLKSKSDSVAIASTEGNQQKESFIARLKRRSSPYFIKIEHRYLKPSCNRYQIKIFIKPISSVSSSLICTYVKDKMIEYLPSDEIDITGNDDFKKLNEVVYQVADELVLTRQNFNNKSYAKGKRLPSIYTSKGIISNSEMDDIFEYNIKLNVRNDIYLSAVSRYSFLTNEISLILRNSTGEAITTSSWLNNDDDTDDLFHSGLSSILKQGTYYLTISQFIGVNHLMQMFYIMEDEMKYIHRCFDFGLNIQTSKVEQENKNINKIISVEPSSLVNHSIKKPLALYITFSDSISNKPKAKSSMSSIKPKTFITSFYFTKENSDSSFLYPSRVNLDSSQGKVFTIEFDENLLNDDTCYILHYDLSNVESFNKSANLIVTDDSPIIHKYCTKKCECNINTSFECNTDGTCICKDPYKGDHCEKCIDNYYMTKKGVCINQENCDSSVCNEHGKCYKGDNDEIKCLCSSKFKGETCERCQSDDMIYPDCMSKEEINKTIDDNDKKSMNYEALKNEKISRTENDCQYQFIPNDLDTLAYLHLDGNMHIAGKYSLKSFKGKHFTMKFTLKETSHFKLHVENAKMNTAIAMFLLDRDNTVQVSSKTLAGPSGVGTASVIDFFADIGEYFIVFYVKDIGSINDININFNYAETSSESDNEIEDCVNVFMELQVMTMEREKNVINAMCSANKKEEIPRLIPVNMTVYDYQSKFYITLSKGISYNLYHVSSPTTENTINYFHYEYIYIPDYVDKQLVIELDINSKFLTVDIGVVIEIVELPSTMKTKVNKLSNERIQSLLQTKVSSPLCEIHCFTGIKKYNSVVINRVLPSDTFIRIWFYDKPQPKSLSLSSITTNTCKPYQISLMLYTITASKEETSKLLSASLCKANEIPSNLNIKEYLGDRKYIKRFGFHILDDFRIDRIGVLNNAAYTSSFWIDTYHLFRLIVFPSRVDTDLELYYVDSTKGDILISRSNSKNFEDVIAIEIPPGKYKIMYKFFAPQGGFHKCETMRMEFAMMSLKNVNENVQRMLYKYKNNIDSMLKTKISMLQHIKNSNELYNKDLRDITYAFPIERAFVINEDDKSKYVASNPIAEMTFVIEEKDSKKIQINAFAISDFIYVDLGIYITFTPSNIKDKSGIRTVSSTHRKNMNVINTKRLHSGTYVVSLRYYRRLHYKAYDSKVINEERLTDAKYAMAHFDIEMINTSDDEVTILTSEGYLKIQPKGSKSVSQNRLCRRMGLPVPKTLSSLRFIAFELEAHIIDNFLLPPLAMGQDIIPFHLEKFPSAMIRVYIECALADISVTLQKKTFAKKVEEITKSSVDVHFATIMALIDDQNEYEIVIDYKGYTDKESAMKSCGTFKMEIAIEKNHNYACPDNNKYKLLTEEHPIPKALPFKFNTKGIDIYKYNSRDTFKGEMEDSGYLYLLRNEQDTYFDFASFTATKPIDIKIEVSNDFIQAPITIMLTSANNVAFEDQRVSSLIKNTFAKMNVKGFVIAYGDLYEGRTSLLVKNLPVGDYTVYLYVPGLKTKFLNERVCSIYDIIVETKKSRNHFKAKEIIHIAETSDDALNIPTRLPISLNTPRFMNDYGKYTYVNIEDYFFLRYNSSVSTTNEYFEMLNTMPFTLATPSFVAFSVRHDDININKDINIAIDGKTSFNKSIAIQLNAGNYTTTIKFTEKREKSTRKVEDFVKDSIVKLIKLYIGIVGVNRVTDEYTYNSMLSSYRQCITTKLPSFNYLGKNGVYRYKNSFFTVRREEIKNKIIDSAKISLKKSNRNRLIANLGGDFVLTDVSLDVIAGNKRYKMQRDNNNGFIDLTLPRGVYEIQLVMNSEIKAIPEEHSCFMFSIDIHIIEIDIASVDISNSLTKTENNEPILKPKCEGSVIPLEIFPSSEIAEQRINKDGSYTLHLDKAVYFTLPQKSKMKKNLNEIDINVQYDTLLHITTKVESSKIFSIIPKVKYSHLKDPSKVYVKVPRGVMVSPNFKERSTFYHLQKNANRNDDYYTLQLGLDQDIASIEDLPTCPVYDIDINLVDLKSLSKKFNCVKKDGKVYQVQKPKKEIFNLTLVPYHEKLPSSYFTEKEYAQYIVNNEFYSGLSYKIAIETKNDVLQHYLNVEIGYHHSVSLFDMFLLSSSGDLVSYSSTLYDKNGTFPYKRVLQTMIAAGNYSLVIMEYEWHNMTNLIKAKAEHKNDVYLCLPFSYSIDIVAINDEQVGTPEVLSIFPPGPIIFKSKDTDITFKIVLSKAAFTKKQEPITMIYNFMNIVNAFYITKKTTDKEVRINPDKVQGSVNNKEWELLFMKEHFEEGADYQFGMEEGWLFDSTRFRFRMNVNKPVIRVESNKDNVIEPEKKDDISNVMKSAINIEIEKPVEKPIVSPFEMINRDNNKCNGHGTYVYDNILGKYLCTCFDGFTGKYCDYCEGKIVNNRCIDNEGDYDSPSSGTIETATMSDYSRPTYETNSQNNKENRPTNNGNTSNYSRGGRKSMDRNQNDCGGCVNGICNVETNKCICDENYKGVHCDERKISSYPSAKQSTIVRGSKLNSNMTEIIEYFVSSILGNLILIVVIIIIVLYVVRWCLQRGKPTEYDILGQNELEVQPASINPSEPKFEIDESNEDNNLVDYEISTIPKKKEEEKVY